MKFVWYSLVSVSVVGLFVVAQNETRPGVRIRVSEKGLAYANAVASQVFANELRKMVIPDYSYTVNQGPGQGNLRLSGVKLAELIPPKFSAKTQAPNKLTWTARDGYAKLKGNWSARYRAGITLKGSGEFTATIQGIPSSIKGDVIKDQHGRPQIVLESCEVSITTLSTDIEGGFVGWLVSKFHRKIEKYLQNAMIMQMTQRLTIFLKMHANHLLSSMPTMVAIPPALVLDYRLIEDPQMSEKFVDTLHAGEISWQGQGNTPFQPHLIPVTNASESMVYFWASDFVVRSMLHAVYTNSQLRYLANARIHPQIAPFLRTTCSEEDTCLLTVFPGLDSPEYANRSASIALDATEIPVFTFRDGRSTLNSVLRAHIFLDPTQTNSNQAVPIATTRIEFVGQIKLKVKENRVVGELEIIRFGVIIEEAHVEAESQWDLDFMLMVVEPMLQDWANKSLRKGLPLPVLKGFRLVNPVITMMLHRVQIASDVVYAPQ